MFFRKSKKGVLVAGDTALAEVSPVPPSLPDPLIPGENVDIAGPCEGRFGC